jgi:hydrogenase maturation protein HypF
VEGDPLAEARKALAAGAIVAVRGLGGFLLVADAANGEAVRRLRERKNRPHKPFAVMARSLEVVRQAFDLDPQEDALLASSASPIVIFPVPPEAGVRRVLPLDRITPDTATLAVMLPTTPLHALLASPLATDPVKAFDWLIMTSGNRGGEPICLSNDEALERLGGIADVLLLHDREINLRNDDSIGVLQRGKPQLWRRARGYAPQPVRLGRPLARCVLAMGAELKNAMAVAFDDQAVLSPHVGDLDAPEAVEALRRVAAELPRFVNRTPDVVAVDLHPDMHATRVGREIATQLGLPVVEVQHHHAHAAAGLGEHGFSEGLALVFDGMGLGTDGHGWGAELLAVTGEGFERLASFAGAPVPGGDAAVRRPARQLAGRFYAAGLDAPATLLERLAVSDEEWRVWIRQCAAGLNAPVTHAAGRLFDSFSALLGCASGRTTYEGQTAIRLEAAALRHPAGVRPPRLEFGAAERDGMLWIDWRGAFARLLEEGPLTPGQAEAWALACHVAIAEAAVKMITYSIDRTKVRTLSLSGGVFMNRILNDMLVPRLDALGVKVLLHRETPPNDGCIALGQAIVAGS